jgi:CRISPR/Cas system Type II protein with McrA/HNH and RuvC-like nuclease domain
LKETAWRQLGSGSFAGELRRLFEQQNARCPYTGELLVLGENTDLDHRVPKASGGSREIGNVQWVLSIVNKMKWNQTEKEFLDLVRKIHQHRSL